jgi:predicted Zn-dependent protease
MPSPVRVLRGSLALLLLLPQQLFPAQSGELTAKSERGSQAMAAGRFDEAVAIYADLARALPNDAGPLLNLGMAQSLAGRARDAVRPLARAVQLQPSLHPAWLFLGIAYLDTGQPARAVAPLTRAVATDPLSVKARQMLANAYQSLEQYENASRELRRLTELDRTSASAWYGLGQSHEALAQRAFDSLRRAAPGSAYESLLVADVLESEENPAEAIELLRSALDKLPRMRAAREALAELYELAGDAGRAAEERQRAAGLPPLDCASAKPECEFRKGRHNEAIAALKGRADAESHYWRARAHNELAREAFAQLEALPPSPESHAFRAELYRNQGRHSESVSELRQAATLAPGDRRIQKALAMSLYLSGDYDAAAPLLEALVKQSPSAADLRLLHGDTLLQAQKIDQAIPALEAALRLDPTLLPARASLGRAYLQAGRQADAIPHLKAALLTDEDGTLHYQLARAYQATGQTALAKEMLVKYAAFEKAKRK